MQLRSGRELRLEEGQDVTDRSLGVLVYADEEVAPTYLPWTDVELIRFER